jgi:hypothetical protein
MAMAPRNRGSEQEIWRIYPKTMASRESSPYPMPIATDARAEYTGASARSLECIGENPLVPAHELWSESVQEVTDHGLSPHNVNRPSILIEETLIT